MGLKDHSKRGAIFCIVLISMLSFSACKSEIKGDGAGNNEITNGEPDIVSNSNSVSLSTTEMEALTEKIYELDDNGEYTPQEGDCYIGITFIKAEGNSMELYAVCN